LQEFKVLIKDLANKTGCILYLMSRKLKVQSHHYLLIGVVILVVAGVAISSNYPSIVEGGSIDRRAPTLSNVKVASMTYSPSTPDAYTVTVTWTTNEPATQWVCQSPKKLASPSKFSNCTGINNYSTDHSMGMYMVPGTRYYIARSQDAAGNMGYSAILSVTVPPLPSSDTTPPSVPAGLSGSAISSSQISLAWSASIDNVGVKGYKVYRNGGQVATSSGTSFTDGGLAASTLYSYAVAAYDIAGNTSVQSSPVSTTTLIGTTTNATSTP
jgi:hypothetical protein